MPDEATLVLHADPLGVHHPLKIKEIMPLLTDTPYNMAKHGNPYKMVKKHIWWDTFGGTP